MKSMTGFGTATKTTPSVEIDISIKAVNSRFLETYFHGPKDYVVLETQLKKILSKEFSRGKVDIYIHRKRSAERMNIKYNIAAGKKWLMAYKKMAHSLGLEPEISPLEVVQAVPEVLKLEHSEELNDREESLVLKAAAEAIRQCKKERRREGSFLKKELLHLTGLLNAQVSIIVNHRKEANALLHQRFLDRIKKSSLSQKLDEQRLASEVAILLDKMNITEEVARLKEHIRNFKKLLQKNDPIGKKLDFYTQELLRETNTIGSKSYVSQLTSAVVDAKSIIEQIREQVQNVE